MGVALNPWNVENFKDLSGSPSKASIPTGGTRDAKGMGVARQPVNEILQEFCLQKIPHTGILRFWQEHRSSEFSLVHWIH